MKLKEIKDLAVYKVLEEEVKKISGKLALLSVDIEILAQTDPETVVATEKLSDNGSYREIDAKQMLTSVKAQYQSHLARLKIVEKLIETGLDI